MVFRESVFATVSISASERFNARFRQPLRGFYRHGLDAAVGVADESTVMNGLATMKRLFQGIKDEAGMGNPDNPPANDPPGKGVDQKCHMHLPPPGGPHR